MPAGRGQTLVDSLFPPAPALRIGWRAVALATAAAVLGVVLQVVRLPAGIATNTVWADDGPGFLAAAMHHGRLASFATPYAGYLNSTARFMAAIAATVPLRFAAFVLGAGSALVVCLLAGLVYLSMRGHIPSRTPRLIFAAVIVLIPAVGKEIEDNAANLHWYVVFAAVWVLLARPPGWGERLVGAAVCLVAALSDPLVGVFLPLAAIRLAATRNRRDWIVVVALVAGLAVQLPFILSVHSVVVTRPSVLDVLRVFAGHVLLPTLAGGSIGQRLWEAFAWTSAIVAALMVAAIYAGLIVSRRLRVEAVLTGGLAVLSLTFTAAEMWARWGPVFLPLPASSIEVGARYWTVPSLLLWSAAIVVVGSAGFTALRRATAVRWRAGVVIWLVVLCAVDFVALNPGRDGGPLWSDQLAAATQTCRGSVTAATVTVPPDPTWSFKIPCNRLRE